MTTQRDEVPPVEGSYPDRQLQPSRSNAAWLADITDDISFFRKEYRHRRRKWLRGECRKDLYGQAGMALVPL
ncbi:hypothetical protein TVD_01705 [Thioalkalivibrio versutus]|uniref:Uncharacterized protein n=1 Tax=Thioalkalivibrio versutus TaxID=106634 RepID=A0A0G3G1B6_9GAMM|nr:hypothetical protein TVD_01705 [Thioalkalivibrio versutus]